MKIIQYHFLYLFTFAIALAGNSPVDQAESLTLVSDDFELADGPSWSGWALTVPDPKSQVAKRFVPKQKKWQAVAREKRFSASFFNHGKTYFADNGTGAIPLPGSKESMDASSSGGFVEGQTPKAQ